jgi:hypothetical protein
MDNLLSTRELIARMTPTALAETIASIEDHADLDAAEMATLIVLETALVANVGEVEAAELVAKATY